MAKRPSTDDSVKRSDVWMPIFWGDYAKDTGHLSAVHHGAYLMLIKHYWVTRSPLPDDDAQLWRIACCDSLAHWRKIRPVVLAFFQEVGGKIGHKRVEAELARAVERSEKAKSSANKRWKKSPPEECSGDANAYARASLEHAPSICLGDAIHNSQEESSSSSIGTDPAREAPRAGGARLARSAAELEMANRLAELASRKRVMP